MQTSSAPAPSHQLCTNTQLPFRLPSLFVTSIYSLLPFQPKTNQQTLNTTHMYMYKHCNSHTFTQGCSFGRKVSVLVSSGTENRMSRSRTTMSRFTSSFSTVEVQRSYTDKLCRPLYIALHAVHAIDSSYSCFIKHLHYAVLLINLMTSPFSQ